MFPIKLIHLMKNNMKTLYFMRTHFSTTRIYIFPSLAKRKSEKGPKELPQIVSSIVFETW